jgi:2,4-dienoyl-CoA reductase-like NADH-dependent reductase (Old Yellow Enzyme family)
MVSGRVVEIDQAANAIASGQADLVAMSRAHISEPHILRKALVGERYLIKRCIGDNACL